jgi:hypothetical protein
MRRVLVTFIVIVVLVLLVNHADGGTLDRGVQTSSFFIAGGPSGDSLISQLKYQMAIDARIGLKDRYTMITNTYNYNYNTNSGTFNTFDNNFNVEASGGAIVTVNNTYGNH